MAESTRDLWPPDLGVPPLVPPVAILREQAALLSQKFKGFLEGEVVTRAERGPSDRAHPFLHEFRIRAPALGDYRYELFDVRHDFELYPVIVRFYPGDLELNADSEESFLKLLKQIFSFDSTRRVIGALLANSGFQE